MINWKSKYLKYKLKYKKLNGGMQNQTQEFLQEYQDKMLAEQEFIENDLPIPLDIWKNIWTIPYIDNIENGDLLYLLSHSKLTGEVFKTKLNIINLTVINKCPNLMSGKHVINAQSKIINPLDQGDDYGVSRHTTHTVRIHPPNTLINNQILSIHSDMDIKLQELSPTYLCKYNDIGHYIDLQYKMIDESHSVSDTTTYSNLYFTFSDELHEFNLIDEELYIEELQYDNEYTLADLCGSLEARGFKGTIIFNGCREQHNYDKGLSRTVSSNIDTNIKEIFMDINSFLNKTPSYIDQSYDEYDYSKLDSYFEYLFTKHRENSLSNLNILNKLKIQKTNNSVISHIEVVSQYLFLKEIFNELSHPILLSAITNQDIKSKEMYILYDHFCAIKDNFKNYFTNLEYISFENYLDTIFDYDLNSFNNDFDIQNKLKDLLIKASPTYTENYLKKFLKLYRLIEDELLSRKYITYSDITNQLEEKMYYIVRPHKNLIETNPFEFIHETVKLRKFDNIVMKTHKHLEEEGKNKFLDPSSDSSSDYFSLEEETISNYSDKDEEIDPPIDWSKDSINHITSKDLTMFKKLREWFYSSISQPARVGWRARDEADPAAFRGIDITKEEKMDNYSTNFSTMRYFNLLSSLKDLEIIYNIEEENENKNLSERLKNLFEAYEIDKKNEVEEFPEL